MNWIPEHRRSSVIEITWFWDSQFPASDSQHLPVCLLPAALLPLYFHGLIISFQQVSPGSDLHSSIELQYRCCQATSSSQMMMLRFSLSVYIKTEVMSCDSWQEIRVISWKSFWRRKEWPTAAWSAIWIYDISVHCESCTLRCVLGLKEIPVNLTDKVLSENYQYLFWFSADFLFQCRHASHQDKWWVIQNIQVQIYKRQEVQQARAVLHSDVNWECLLITTNFMNLNQICVEAVKQNALWIWIYWSIIKMYWNSYDCNF